MKRFYLWYKSHFYKPNGGKAWGYREAGWLDPQTKEVYPTRPCVHCKGKCRHQRYMLGLHEGNKGQALCILHYIQEVPVEAERLMLKLVRPLSIAVLSLTILVSASSYAAFSRSKILFRSAVARQQIENVVDWAYRERSRNVAREMIRQEVETVAEESPNLAFFVLACALIDIESKWDPGAYGKMKTESGKWQPSGAKGSGMVVASKHLKEMREAGCREDKDLHHPILGTRTAVKVLKTYMQLAKGNTSTALRYYLQGEGSKYAGVGWNMSPDKYFVVTVNTQGEIMLVLDSKVERNR